MPKTTKAQKRAQVNYFQRLKAEGYKRVAFIIKPEWKPRFNALRAELIAELEKYKG